MYFRVVEESFKDHTNHTKSFTHEDYASDTELSKEYWKIEQMCLPRLHVPPAGA